MASKKKHDSREKWLIQAVKVMIPLLKQNKATMPKKWAVSVGFPKGGFKNNPAIGECWDPKVSENQAFNMFISPILGDPIKVLATLLHEMIHAAVGLECKHTGEFRRVARAVGLQGKLTATYAEKGSLLHGELSRIAKELGHYPHKVMAPRQTPKKQGWFLLKLVSVNDPGYKFTIAPRLVEEFGMPMDYMGDEMVVAEE